MRADCSQFKAIKETCKALAFERNLCQRFRRQDTGDFIAPPGIETPCRAPDAKRTFGTTTETSQPKRQSGGAEFQPGPETFIAASPTAATRRQPPPGRSRCDGYPALHKGKPLPRRCSSRDQRYVPG